MDTLDTQIEDAFHYRGHVSIMFKNGNCIEGFLYNREWTNPKLKEDRFIEVFLKGTGEHQRFPMASITKIERSGEDCAAGKSYQDWLEKQHRPPAQSENDFTAHQKK